MSTYCTHCRKMYETQVALDAVSRSQLAAKDAEIAKLREALKDVQARIEILADDGVWWIDEPHLCGFNLYQIDQALNNGDEANRALREHDQALEATK